MSWFARAAEIGRNHETNLNSLKKLAKRRNRTVDVVSKEKRETRSRHKRSNKGTNKEDSEKKASEGKERQHKKNKHRR